MIKVEFFKENTLVYITNETGVIKVFVKDVLIDKEGNITYLLKNEKGAEVKRLNSKFVFDDLDKLKNSLMSQIELLTPKSKDIEEENDGQVPEMANSSSL